MLLAAFADDRATFDSLWAWTSANLEIRSDGLAAWRWRPQDKPNVADRNNATDGDLLIAWALAEAGQTWKEPRYDASAARIARAVAAHATYASIFGLAISPGVDGFDPKASEDGPVVNLSYWIFPAFDALARVAPDVDWASLREAGLTLIDAAKFGPRRLPSDWISLKYGVQAGGGLSQAASATTPCASRSISPGARPRKRRAWRRWSKPGPAPRTRRRRWSTSPREAPIQTFPGKGYRAVAALARCAAGGVKFPDELRTVDFETYYPATLQMLALTALRDRRLPMLTSRRAIALSLLLALVPGSPRAETSGARARRRAGARGLFQSLSGPAVRRALSRRVRREPRSTRARCAITPRCTMWRAPTPRSAG